MKYKYVFVLLVYRNSDDLEECIISISKKVYNYRMIVVNAYYNKETYDNIRTIAVKHGCDFINIENKGYSFGNNVGIDYAKKNYEFDYIVISNPDIIIKRFDDSCINKFDIVAPMIIAKNGKKQNPLQARRCKKAEKLIYLGFDYNKKILIFVGILFNRIIKEVVVLLNRNKKYYKIYSAHGSFLIISKKTIDIIDKLYDDNMFLFAEENVLAIKAKKHNIDTYFYNGIEVLHKEDGSMSLADFSLEGELKKANIYFYEKYVMNGER